MVEWSMTDRPTAGSKFVPYAYLWLWLVCMAVLVKMDSNVWLLSSQVDTRESVIKAEESTPVTTTRRSQQGQNCTLSLITFSQAMFYYVHVASLLACTNERTNIGLARHPRFCVETNSHQACARVCTKSKFALSRPRIFFFGAPFDAFNNP